jgi:hypothetical protein
VDERYRLPRPVDAAILQGLSILFGAEIVQIITCGVGSLEGSLLYGGTSHTCSPTATYLKIQLSDMEDHNLLHVVFILYRA